MEYDRHVAVLQGSILGFEKKPLNENDMYLRISKAVENLPDEPVIERKILMCLVLNTDVNEIEQLRQIPEYAPLSGLFRISTGLLIKLVNGRLWRYFLEAIPSVLPVNALSKIIKSLANMKELPIDAFTGKDKYNNILSLIVAVILAEKLINLEKKSDNILVTEVVDLLDIFSDALCSTNVQMKEKLFGILFLLRLICETKSDILQTTIPSSIDFHSSLGISLPSSQIRQCSNAILKKVLSLYVEVAKQTTIDMWIGLSEENTDMLVNDFPYISTWEAGKNAPSTLQMLLAHYSYEINEYLCQNDLLNSNPQALQILASFAKRYDRISELNLENMDSVSILKKLDALEQESSRAKTDGEWQRFAYSEYLLKNMWDEVMGTTAGVVRCNASRNIQTLTNNSKYLVNFCDKFYMEVSMLKRDDLLREEKLALLLATFRHLVTEDAKKLLFQRLAEHGVDSIIFFDHSNFPQDLRHFLNKIVLNETTFTYDAQQTIELYRLAFQSPKKVIFYLIDEAIENKGKVEIVAKVLQSLPNDITQYSVTTSIGECMLITNAMMLKFIVIHDVGAGEEVNNFCKLMEEICSKDEDIAKNVALHFMKNIVNIKSFGPMLNILQLTLKFTCYDNYSKNEKISILATLCQTASFIYQQNKWDISLTIDLPVLLGILERFLHELHNDKDLFEKIVRTFLHEELHGYLLKEAICHTNLRDVLRAMYFDKQLIEYTAPKNFVVELSSCLPTLLPKEWDIISNLTVNGEYISEFDLVGAGQLLISTNSIEYEHLEYVMQSLGAVISHRFEDGKPTSTDESKKNIKWLLNFHSNLCQLIGKLSISMCSLPPKT